MSPRNFSHWLNAAVMAIGLAAILIAVNATILARESLLEHGQEVLLRLAPLDPRSLMQGDYMALRFEISPSIARHAGASDGRVVVKVAADKTGNFSRMDDGSPLSADERLLEFKTRKREVKIVTDAYFFEEGSRQRFERARYGVFRVGHDGKALLTDLADESKVAIPLRGAD